MSTAAIQGRPVENIPTTNIARAVAQVQKIMPTVFKDAVNPHHNNKYATLKTVWDAAREPIETAGLAVAYGPYAAADGSNRFAIYVTHLESGEVWISTMPLVTENKNVNQGYGAAITYAQRYLLCSAFAIVSEDDDGESAGASDQDQRQGQNKGQRYQRGQNQGQGQNNYQRRQQNAAQSAGADSAADQDRYAMMVQRMNKARTLDELNKLAWGEVKAFAESAQCSAKQKSQLQALRKLREEALGRAAPRRTNMDHQVDRLRAAQAAHQQRQAF